MIVTFCGSREFVATVERQKQVLSLLEERVGDQAVEFYLGGYGKFDSFAYTCARKYKETHPKATLVFVTPYITESYQKNHLECQKTQYDSILYPSIEKVPPRYAILCRNQYMVEKADLLIAWVDHNWGGA